MIQLNGLSLSFGTQIVFDSLSVTVSNDEKVGLVGRNGSGKSTLLKAVAGLQRLDAGSVSFAGKGTVAYMPQEVILNSSRSIVDEAFSAFTEMSALKDSMKALEPAMQAGDDEAACEYANMSTQLHEMQADQAMGKVKRMLSGLGFAQDRFDEPMTSLSVGWQMRIVLAKLLLQEADFYLFDEPTNHLDIVAKDWFLEFLKYANFGFMLVCHDKYFLDQLCTKILELEQGRGTMYQGNYKAYEEQKASTLAHLQAAHRQQQKEVEQKRKTIERFRATASKAKMARSMERALDKVEMIELPHEIRSIGFTFNITERSGRMVLEVDKLAYSFEGAKKPIFKDITLHIERGEKVAVIAPNGVGKTTLFNVLCGKYKHEVGKVDFGYNVKTAIFEQEQHKVLNPRKTVLQEVMDSVGDKSEQEIRSCLGAFLFSQNEVGKKTSVLSGGERNRVSMVKVLLQGANFLLLDEPTNHLDIQSKEVLFKALEKFEGTMLFVSHDHECINRLATRVLELTPDGVFSYQGNYDAFLEQKADLMPFQEKSSSSEVKEDSAAPAKMQKNDFEFKKQVQKFERKIEKIESEIDEIRDSFGVIGYGSPAFAQAQKNLKEKEAQLQNEYMLWEKMVKEAE